MKLQHTPAPWKQGTMITCICQNNDTCSHIFEKECYIFPTTDDIGPIAIISDEANALLIAAAPEMLEALIEFYKSDGYNELAKTAIEKATGMKIEDLLK